MSLSMQDIEVISKMITEEAKQTREVFMLELRNVNRNVRDLNTTIKSHNGRLREAEVKMIQIDRDIDNVKRDGVIHELDCPLKTKVDALIQDKAIRVSVKHLAITIVTLIALILGAVFSALKISDHLTEQQFKKYYEIIQSDENEKDSVVGKPMVR